MNIHINQLPIKRNYAILDNEFNEGLFSGLMILFKSISRASKEINIPKSVLGRFCRKEVIRIRIDSLLKIISSLKISLERAEGRINWIGALNSRGITYPHLPFYFDSRFAARFIAAICNDGCITVGYRKGEKYSYGRLLYNNNEKSLLNSVKRDAEYVFGQNLSKLFIKRGDSFLSFPSVIRDILEIITDFKGKKSINNPSIPSFIIKDKELMAGWIEQTIADEGQVKYEPEKYRREIIWRRSFNSNLKSFNLIRDECKILKKIGIGFDLKDIGTYLTKEQVEKTRMQIRISRRNNIIKLAKLIKIPDDRKQKKFEEMIASISP